ncbi:protein phosphatase 2C domain-containing protein [Streptomyces tsukubensis]
MNVVLDSVPASHDRENEDFVAAAPGAAVLLDGAGVGVGDSTGCTHGVAWFSGMLGALLLRSITAAPVRPLSECLADAILAVRAMHADTCDTAHPASPASTVVAVRVSERTTEYLLLGDSSLLLAARDGTVTAFTDRRLDEIGAAFRGGMDRLPTGSAEHTVALAAYRARLSEHRNRPGGYWVASNDPEAGTHALTGTVPTDTLSSLTLMSDGASRLVDRFCLDDWSGAVALVRDDGPRALIRHVRDAEASDPDGRRWPRGKSRDDASVLHWRLG